MNFHLFIALHLIKKTKHAETSLLKQMKSYKNTQKTKNSKSKVFLNSRYKNKFLNSQFTIPVLVKLTIHDSEFLVLYTSS